MEIKKTITTKHAEAVTSNAKYELEFTIQENTIIRLYASIYGLETVDESISMYIGYISSDNGMLNCSIPADKKTSPFFNDFETFMQEMNNSIQTRQVKK